MRITPSMAKWQSIEADRPQLADFLKVGDRIEATVVKAEGAMMTLKMGDTVFSVQNEAGFIVAEGDTLLLELTGQSGDVFLARPAGGAPATISDTEVLQEITKSLDLPREAAKGPELNTMIRSGLPLTKEVYQALKLGRFLLGEIAQSLPSSQKTASGAGQRQAGQTPAPAAPSPPAQTEAANPTEKMSASPETAPTDRSAPAAPVEGQPPLAGSAAPPSAAPATPLESLPLKAVFQLLAQIDQKTGDSPEREALFADLSKEGLAQLAGDKERTTEALALLMKMQTAPTLKNIRLLDQTVFGKEPAVEHLAKAVLQLQSLFEGGTLSASMRAVLEEEPPDAAKIRALLSALTETSLPEEKRESARMINNEIDAFRQKMDFLGRVNEQFHFVHVPLEQEGKLYGMDLLVKRSKRQKEDGGPVTLYIGLDTHRLGRVKAIFTADKKKLAIRFRLTSKSVKDRIDGALDSLEKRLVTLGFSPLLIETAVETTEDPSFREVLFSGTIDDYRTIDARV